MRRSLTCLLPRLSGWRGCAAAAVLPGNALLVNRDHGVQFGIGGGMGGPGRGGHGVLGGGAHSAFGRVQHNSQHGGVAFGGGNDHMGWTPDEVCGDEHAATIGRVV